MVALALHLFNEADVPEMASHAGQGGFAAQSSEGADRASQENKASIQSTTQVNGVPSIAQAAEKRAPQAPKLSQASSQLVGYWMEYTAVKSVLWS